MNARLSDAQTQAQVLDDLLARWHQWQGRARVGRGFAPKALVCGEFRVSRQYDDQNGALDDDLERCTMAVVDFQVREMGDPYRSAVYALARALTLGVMVFTSPRLPWDRAQRERVIEEARAVLTARLVRAGVM